MSTHFNIDFEKLMIEKYNKRKNTTLDPRLAPYLNRTRNNGESYSVLQHPLVYAVPYLESLHALYNEQLFHKTLAVTKALTTQAWNSYIYLHERPYRLEAFFRIKDKLTDAEYWKLLSSIYTDSENIWQNLRLWCQCIKSKRKQQHLFMDTNLEEYKKLPETFTIYRGCTAKLNESGLSYSLDKKIADFFARRLNKKETIIIEREVWKDNIFAFLDNRSEKEIIIKPQYRKIRTEK